MASIIYCFTETSDVPLTELISRCGVSRAWSPSSQDPPPNIQTFSGLWDTGATCSVISQEVVDKCKLTPISKANVTGVTGTYEADVYLVNISLPNRVGFPGLPVVLGNVGGADLLIGMDIIGKGDFAVSNYKGGTMFSFRYPSDGDVDFCDDGDDDY